MLLGPNVDKNEITETLGNDINVIAPPLPGDDEEEDFLMPETISEFISKVIEIADKKDKIELDNLCRNSRFDLHSRDGAELNVTQQLASKGNKHACFWLAEQGAKEQDLASGAAHGGHEDLTNELIQFMEERQIQPNYQIIVKCSAYGGHASLTWKLICQMEEEKKAEPNYQLITQAAGYGLSITHKFLNEWRLDHKT